MSSPPSIPKPPQSPAQNITVPPKYLTDYSQHLTILSVTTERETMSVAYQSAQKQRYRVTLELDVFGDFDPHQIDWEKLFKLEPAEKCESYVEDLSTPESW